MKKILFVSDSVRVGGIQKSLVNMLNNIDYSKFDVSLLLFNDRNTSDINKNVNILQSYEILRIIGSTADELKRNSILKYYIRKILSLLCHIFGSNFIFAIIFKKIKILDEFDIAISYSNNVSNRSLYFGYNKFVIEKIKSRVKKCWIHIDYHNKQRNQEEMNEYMQMDEIILVSDACKKSFINLYPELENKTKVVYNIIDKKQILELSNLQEVNFDDKTFNIISIGRIENNKNIEAQLMIANNLANNGLKFKWYVIGNGIDYYKVKNKIFELKLDDVFFLLGEKKNVYPYIKKSSLLVSTSLSESFGLTIAEALTLDVPVVALNYPALKEIVSENNICNNLVELYDKISKLIKNKKEYQIYKRNSYYLISEKIVENQIKNVLGGEYD